MRAAIILSLLGYRRGLKSYQRILSEFEERAVRLASPGLLDAWEWTEEARFVRELLPTIGMIHSEEAHAELVRTARHSPLKGFRCYAIDGMAYEETYFDIEILLEVLRTEEDTDMVCSALWALQFHTYRLKGRRRLMRDYVLPLLAREVPRIHQYAIDVLKVEPLFMEAIRPFLSDPNTVTAESARDAIDFMEDILKERQDRRELHASPVE